MTIYFSKRRIIVKNEAGEVVERYGSLKEFHAAYPMTGTYNSVAKKVCGLVDGWMPDGKTPKPRYKRLTTFVTLAR